MDGIAVGKAIWLAGLALLASSPRQAPAPLFTEEERQAVVQFWAQPGRYLESLPPDSDKVGPFEVRLTVEGSTWLREYNRLRGMNKVAPTTTAKPQNEQQKGWQDWIDAKIEHDRWMAEQVAQQSNRKLAGHDTKLDDRTLPPAEPPDPGPAPADLIAFAGDPPRFADSVVPMMHQISFDDGTKISFADNVKMRKNYAYYRFRQGVNWDGDTVKEMPEDHLRSLCQKAGLSDSEFRVMKAVSMLEGGFDAINTYDTGFVSVGFIQFATLKDGGNSLGDMMKLYKDEDPQDFQTDFRRYGIDVTPDAKLACLDPATGAELTGEAAVRKVIDDPRLIAVFDYDGEKSDAYDAMQLRSAKAQFFPADDPISVDVNGRVLAGKVSDVFHSEAGLATLMDRKVNTGHLDPLPETLQDFAAANQVASLADLAKYEHDIVQALQYRRDFLASADLSQPDETVRSKPLASRGGDRGKHGGH
ncbi:MAG TPA: hypothetical protein VMI31_14680 [Fimbriimonadaceae bacterium]|nr:hypothetical protein [Fimbriimonadaceae bacterium]